MEVRDSRCIGIRMSGFRSDESSSSITLHSVDNDLGQTQSNLKIEDTYSSRATGKYLGFGLLILPTVFSVLLLASNFRGWEASGTVYDFIAGNRATTQLIVQVLANTLSLTQVLVLCRLINYATRIRMRKFPTSLDTMGLWAAFSTPTMDWRLPFKMMPPLLAFIGISPLLSALWAGALTPVETDGSRNSMVHIPDWTNISLVKEYPAEIDRTGPSIIHPKGHFTYSVGMSLLTALVSSARTASTPDQSVWRHPKLDNTGFSYRGRSYGVGASVGLSDDLITGNPRATNYSFLEVGYESSVDCVYNYSSLYTIHPLNDDLLYAAEGPLPDSDGSREYSVFFGRSTKPIVAAGVSYVQTTGTRYVALAAGSYYKSLNLAQCPVAFNPAWFNVSVETLNKEITVQKIADARDFDPTRNVTHVAIRQIELISNDLTSLYRSVLGDAFNTSISDYRTSVAHSPTPPSDEDITLTGLKNSITALIDDILGSYAAAQLMVGKLAKPTPVVIHMMALRLGSAVYIIATVALNIVVIAVVVIEAARTRGWKNLLSFDYTDLRSLVVASNLGGANGGSRGQIPDIGDNKHKGKMKVHVGMTQFQDKVRRYQVTLGNPSVYRGVGDGTDQSLLLTTNNLSNSHDLNFI